MRVLSKARRQRRALLYTVAAWAILIGGAWSGALAGKSALSWLLPILGLCGYALCASVAMRLWQGRRTIPRPPRARLVRMVRRRGLEVSPPAGERAWPPAPGRRSRGGEARTVPTQGLPRR